jgi:hypothetical protein
MAKMAGAWRSVLMCFAVSTFARAQDSDLAKGSLGDLMQVMSASDTSHGRFQLQLPIIGKPLTIAWQVGSEPTYETLSWPTYDWQTVLLSRGPVELFAFNRVKPAIELGCLSTTCRPIQEKTFGAEMRMNLGGRGALPKNYLFLRHGTVRTPLRSFSRFGVGIGGLLDL